MTASFVISHLISAESMAPGRLVAPSTTMPRLSSNPSICAAVGFWRLVIRS
jgi:hypothetical protein